MIARVPAAPLHGARWDPRYWDPRFARPLEGLDPAFPIADLGDDLLLITYGPIVTGVRPEPVPDGTFLITGKAFTPSGLDLSRAVRVRPGCAFDPERSRLRRRDLLLPRSGVGSLGRRRMAVWDDPRPANIGCFVDLLRLQRLNPYYVWAFLRGRFGWRQISRLINGVAQPNLSFAEVRALRIAVPDARFQAGVEAAFRTGVEPLHRAFLDAAPGEGAAARARAERAVEAWVLRVEAWLAGEAPPL